MALVRGVIILGGGWLMSRTRGVVIAELNARFHPRYAPLPPAGPPVLSGVTGTAEGTVELSWSNGATEPARTKLYRSPAGAGTFVEIADLSLSAKAFVDTPGSFDTLYDYRAAHYNVTDYSAYATVQVRSQVDKPDADPSGLTATTQARPAGETKITLAWTNNDATCETDVYYRTGTGAYQSVRVAAGASSYVFTGSPDTPYEFYAKHFKNGYSSGSSNTATARTLVDGPDADPTAPSAVQGAQTVDGEKKIVLGWTNGDGTAATEIYVSSDGTSFSYLATVGAGVPGYTHDTGSFNVRRWYRFRHIKNGVGSGYTATVDAYSGVDVPNGSPSSLAGTTQGVPQGETTIQVTWVNGDASCVTEIFRRLKGATTWGLAVHTASAGATSWTNSGLSPNTEYEYLAEHVKSGVRSNSSNIASAKTLVDGPDADPSSCAASHTSAGNVDVSWSNGDGSASTEVYRNGLYWTTVGAGVASVSETRSAGSTTKYKVRHAKNSVYSGFSNEPSVTVPTVPAAPTFNSLVGGDGKFTLGWSNNDATASIQILRDGAVITTVAAGTTSAALTGYGEGVTHTFTLRATRDGFTSADSTSRTATTNDPVNGPPTLLSASSITYKSARLTWTNGDSTAVTKVYVRSAGAASWSLLGTVSAGGTYIDWSGLTPETGYEFFCRHEKTDSNGNTTTADSTVASFTTSAVPAPTWGTVSHRGSDDNFLGGSFSRSWSNAAGDLGIEIHTWWDLAHRHTQTLAAGTTSANADMGIPAAKQVDHYIRHTYGGKVSGWIQVRVDTPAGPDTAEWNSLAPGGGVYVDGADVVANYVRKNTFDHAMLRLLRDGTQILGWTFVDQSVNFYHHPHNSIAGVHTYYLYRYRNGYRSSTINKGVRVGPLEPELLDVTAGCTAANEPFIDVSWVGKEDYTEVWGSTDGTNFSEYERLTAGESTWRDQLVVNNQTMTYKVRHKKDGIYSGFSGTGSATADCAGSGALI